MQVMVTVIGNDALESSVDGQALLVPGIGWIAQYHNYATQYHEKGIAYFIRDVWSQELRVHPERAAELGPALDKLNSKLENSKRHANGQVE